MGGILDQFPAGGGLKDPKTGESFGESDDARAWQQLFRPFSEAWAELAPPDPRVFLCSASTPPSGGVHGMCGHLAARAMLRLEGPQPL